MHIEAEIEIEVPEGLQGPELVKWLHKEYFGLLDARKVDDRYTPKAEAPKNNQLFEQYPAPKGGWKSEKQEVFMRGMNEVSGEIETQATVDQVYGTGCPPSGAIRSGEVEGYEWLK